MLRTGGFMALAASALSILVAQPHAAQESYSLARTQVFTMDSKQTGSAYRIYVAWPAAYELSKNTFPTVYLLDGDWYFGLTVSSSRLLEAVGEQRPSIIVGIGYGGAVQDQRRRRVREFTPVSEPTLSGSGHAAQFLSALREEIIPVLEQRYRASGERVLVGHSLGGLFAAYAMTRVPDLFRHYVIGSPAFWAMRDKIEREVAERMQRGGINARVFVGVSSGDPDAIRSAYFAMVRTLETHASAELRWSAADFPKSSHQSSVMALVASGLPWVLPAK